MDAKREGCIVPNEFVQVKHDDCFGLGRTLDRCLAPHVIGVLVEELFCRRVNMRKGQDIGHIQAYVGIRLSGGVRLCLAGHLIFQVVMHPACKLVFRHEVSTLPKRTVSVVASSCASP